METIGTSHIRRNRPRSLVMAADGQSCAGAVSRTGAFGLQDLARFFGGLGFQHLRVFSGFAGGLEFRASGCCVWGLGFGVR